MLGGCEKNFLPSTLKARHQNHPNIELSSNNPQSTHYKKTKRLGNKISDERMHRC